jgi:hypothetical protein
VEELFGKSSGDPLISNGESGRPARRCAFAGEWPTRLCHSGVPHDRQDVERNRKAAKLFATVHGPEPARRARHGGQCRTSARADSRGEQLKTRVFFVPKEGVEPSRPFGRRILNPLRLPFRHFGL